MPDITGIHSAFTDTVCGLFHHYICNDISVDIDDRDSKEDIKKYLIKHIQAYCGDKLKIHPELYDDFQIKCERTSSNDHSIRGPFRLERASNCLIYVFEHNSMRYLFKENTPFAKVVKFIEEDEGRSLRYLKLEDFIADGVRLKYGMQEFNHNIKNTLEFNPRPDDSSTHESNMM
jgi:hypothetical protein